MKTKTNIFHIGAAIWLAIAVYFALSSVVVEASPGIKVHVPPFDPEIYKLNDKEYPTRIVTWDECEETVLYIVAKMIEESPDLEEAIANGEFIVECVELGFDGQVLEGDVAT